MWRGPRSVASSGHSDGVPWRRSPPSGGSLSCRRHRKRIGGRQRQRAGRRRPCLSRRRRRGSGNIGVRSANGVDVRAWAHFPVLSLGMTSPPPFRKESSGHIHGSGALSIARRSRADFRLFRSQFTLTAVMSALAPIPSVSGNDTWWKRVVTLSSCTPRPTV